MRYTLFMLLVISIFSCSKKEISQPQELNISCVPVNKSTLSSDSANVLGYPNYYSVPQLIIYPNPTSGIVNIIIGGKEITAFHISNDKGEFKDIILNSGDYMINLGEEKNGVYCCEAVIDGIVFRTSIIKD
jgi:hypothetical protein